MITGTTRVYGIFGRPVGHSLSPVMHNAAFAAAGLDAVYVPFAVADLAQAVQGLRGLDLGGVSVTIPFKEEILSLLDEIDDQARLIGAVNTVVNREGRLWGTNTDWYGAVAALEEETALAGKRVLILGAGGAGRAIVYAVRQAGGTVLVTDADEARAQTLAQEFGAAFVPLADASQESAAVLINASPVGMAPQAEAIPIDPKALENFSTVMDIVYKPLQTRLLREAAARGCRCIDGLQMLVHQGGRQFELFTGRPALVEIMRQAALAAISE
jgi:shikimate dehydrogenase